MVSPSADHVFCPESGAWDTRDSAVFRGYYPLYCGPCFSPLVRLAVMFVPCHNLASQPPGYVKVHSSSGLGEWWGGYGGYTPRQSGRQAAGWLARFPGAAGLHVEVRNGCQEGAPRGAPKLVKACPRPSVHGVWGVLAGWSLNPMGILEICLLAVSGTSYINININININIDIDTHQRQPTSTSTSTSTSSLPVALGLRP